MTASSLRAAIVGAGRARRAGLAAALLWVLLCVRWFDAAAPLRPRALGAVPPALLAAAFLVAFAVWLRARLPEVRGPGRAGPRGGLVLVLLLAALFRLPVAWPGAAGSVTPDGALSGIVALHARDGKGHEVFVPHVPYSGSLKSHLAAPLALVMDGPRAFVLASVAFYLLFVAAVYALALRVAGEAVRGRVAVAAGLYLAFSPPYVTRYSLSNDGNYVEVLALGTLALLVAVRWIETPGARPLLALVGGVLLGLGFWCHILAVIHAAAFGLALLVAAPRAALRSAPPLALGFALGDLPGLLWNAANDWRSFQYLLPGSGGETSGGTGLGARVVGLFTDQLVFLLGYDPGYGPAVDAASRAFAAGAVALALWALAGAIRRLAAEPRGARFVLLLFAAVNVGVALLALPQIPGNPRYLLFLLAPLAVFVAECCAGRRGRFVLALVVAVGALASLAQRPGVLASEAKWRGFVRDLEDAGVRFCYTDFHLATKINFLSEERVVCSAKLGPTTTEYFFEYREAVERAPAAALVAVNQTSARRLERRLAELGVSYERRDLMKPTLLGLSRKVDPEELFPSRAFPWR